jgi:hypothetical protein
MSHWHEVKLFGKVVKCLRVDEDTGNTIFEIGRSIAGGWIASDGEVFPSLESAKKLCEPKFKGM